MEFPKIYSLLLVRLPPQPEGPGNDHQEVKCLVDTVAGKLATLGVGPIVIEECLEVSETPSPTSSPTVENVSSRFHREQASTSTNEASVFTREQFAAINASHPSNLSELRLWIRYSSPDPDDTVFSDWKSSMSKFERDDYSEADRSRMWTLQHDNFAATSLHGHLTLSESYGDHSPLCIALQDIEQEIQELVLPVSTDAAFIRSLSAAFESLSAHLDALHSNFVSSLTELSHSITATTHPISVRSSSLQSHPMSASSFTASDLPYQLFATHKSDLYSWREIFQVYMESEIFESRSGNKRVSRTVQDAEERLRLFAARLTMRGLQGGRKLRLKQSRLALQTFLQLNIFILKGKKFQLANSEATKHIIEKQLMNTATTCIVSRSGYTTKLTSNASDQSLCGVLSYPPESACLPHIFIQALGESLLPIVPHLDDYTCPICTSIAFKPIRLSCGHLFCVRCLVKLQRRGRNSCPICRSPTVLRANRENLDMAMLNFMKDWFPIEVRIKLRQNEREVANEQLEDFGFNSHVCVIV